MKRLFTLLFVVVGLSSYAQDTTALRWIGVNPWTPQFHFFDDDSTQLSLISSSYGTAHAIFTSNADSMVYMLLDDAGYTGDRNIYQLNPFTGSYTLAYDVAVTYSNSADISEDGSKIYFIEGQAGTTGQITELDVATMTETVVTTALSDGGSSYGIEYHPSDTSLYVYEGNWSGSTQLQRINLNSLTNTNDPLVGWTSQIHGAKWSGVDSVFLVFTGPGSNLEITDGTSTNLTSLYSFPNLCSDLDEFYTLRRPSDTISFCPNVMDSALISTIYDFATVEWYKDGVVLPETNDSIYIFDEGVYQALFPIAGGNFMWSEPIVVQHYTVPNVTITQTDMDSLICPGDTITLTGAAPGGGSVQWYMDGTMIAGATAMTYDATAIGSYNQMKTNMSGCSDTAAVAYVIYEDADCDTIGVSISENSLSIDIYPNPVQNTLNIQSTSTIKSISIVDLSGRKVARFDNVAATSKQIDFEEMTSGIYLVKVKTEQGELTSKIVK